MGADMNTLKLEQRSCSDAVRSKEAELYKVQVKNISCPSPPHLSKRLAYINRSIQFFAAVDSSLSCHTYDQRYIYV